MKMKATKAILTALFLLAAGVIARSENTWTIEASTTNKVTTFTISRTNTAEAETVKYRTVSLSAFAGQHYIAVSGEVTFAVDETSRDVIVTEETPTDDPYKFQTGDTRKYRFEVTDMGGFALARLDREITTGTSVPSSGAFSIKDVVIQESEYLNTAAGYDNNVVKSVSKSSYFDNAAPKAYYQLVGAELRMTLSMDVKESDDGYQYMSILNSTTLYDNRSGCSNGDPGNINNSWYMAGFEHKTGGKDTEYKSYSFPVTSVGNDAGHSNPWGHGTSYILSKQKFNTNRRASDGKLLLPLDFSVIAVRCNASGSDDDDWYAKNVTAHIQAVESTAPTKLGVSVGPGVHAIGNPVYISVAFSEPVRPTSTSFTKLKTSWGDFYYYEGIGSNVLTFWGTIGFSATEQLSISELSGGSIEDLSGNTFNGTITESNLCELDADYNYTITYDLAGGTESTPNPTSYTYRSLNISLAMPTREGYNFLGWTGSNGSTPNRTVTIANNSKGNRHYTANWEHIKYTVVFNKNHADATGYMPNQVFELDEENKLSANVFTLAGYMFVGWNTQADGQGTAYSDQQVVSNLSTTHNASITLYAQWGQLWGIGQGADGSEANPYQISTVADLEYLSDRVNASNYYSGKYFKLMNNISFPHGGSATEHNFRPIGTDGEGFYGNFDGQGFTISGLRIYLPEKPYLGLFGRIRNGAVRNLILDDARITGSTYVGGILGVNISGGVHNCLVTGSTISGTNAGVIIASNSSSATRNYYRNCSAGGNTQNIGSASGDLSGAKALYTITLGDYITITGSRTNGIQVGQNRTFYADGIAISGTQYYTSGGTIALADNGEIPDGYAVWFSVSGIGTLDTDTFTMPSSDVSVSTIINPGLIYIGANGTRQGRDGAIAPIVSGTNEYGDSANGATWYSVQGEQTINGSLSIKDNDVNIILCAGATLTVTDFIVPNGSLSIYAQSDGNQRGRLVVNGGISAKNSIDLNGGSVSAVTSGDKAISTPNGSITIRRGAVNAEGLLYGLYAYNALTIYGGTVNACGTATGQIGGYYSSGIYTRFDEVKILGGNVTAPGHEGIIPAYGSNANANIRLGWSKPSDSITASTYIMRVFIANGQNFTYGDGSVTLSGELSEAEKNLINNQPLRPKATNEESTMTLTANQATLAGQTRYWTTFYHPHWSYELPAGAQAFILKSDKALYRLGDGSIVPAGCAVVIMSDSASIEITLTDANAPAVSGNILLGTTATAAAPSNAHVLSKVDSNFGFFGFTGEIPANKAYYVE